MRATKLLSVSVTLWAVVVGADSASAHGVNLPIVRPSISITPPRPTIVTPPRQTMSLPLSNPRVQINPVGAGGSLPTGVSSGARVIMNKPVTGINSGARAIINQPVGGSLPTAGIKSGARVMTNQPLPYSWPLQTVRQAGEVLSPNRSAQHSL